MAEPGTAAARDAAARLERGLSMLAFDAPPAVAALIEKPAPGVHARRSRVDVGRNGFTGDHDRKSWWRGREVPGRDVTAMAAEVLDLLGLEADVPGDNLITRGVDLSGLREGDRLRIGGVVLRRSEKPHSPCDVFARRSSAAAMRAVAATDTRGALFVVEKEGSIQAGETIRVIRFDEADPA
jgi:MOSC domain-containing protein YiiM